MRPELPQNYPEIDEHLVPGPESGTSIREMSRSSTLWTNEASIYCSSIKQRERSYFRQLIFAVKIYERHCEAQHAYMTILQAVKTGQPHISMNSLFKIKKIKTSESQNL